MAATFLPAPRHNYQVHVDEAAPSSLLASAPKQTVPPYGRRQNFVPRAQADYGDGGAFPEIHVAQFPLDMGRPAVKKAAASGGGKGGGGGEGVAGISGLGNNYGSSAIVAVDVDDSGKVGILPRSCFVPLCRVCQGWCCYVAEEIFLSQDYNSSTYCCTYCTCGTNRRSSTARLCDNRTTASFRFVLRSSTTCIVRASLLSVCGLLSAGVVARALQGTTAVARRV